MSKHVAGHGEQFVPHRRRQVDGGGVMTRYGMVIDVGRCIGCYNCFLACRDEHAGNDHRPVAAAQPDAGHKWIEVRAHERGSFPKVKVSYVPVPCQHCAEAPCIGASDGRRGLPARRTASY